MQKTRSGSCTVHCGVGARQSQYLIVLSQLPVTRQFISCSQNMWRTGASCAPTCIIWFEARSQHFAILSQPPENTFAPSWLHEHARMGASCACAALGTIVPVICTSQHRI